MTVYFCAYALIGLCSVFINRIRIGKSNQKKCVCACGFMILLLVFALRHPSMGIDLGYGTYYGYLGSYTRLSSYTWQEIFNLKSFLNYEKGYIVFNKLISMISSNQQFLLVACAFCSLLPVFYVTYKKSNAPVFSIYIYMALPSFLMLFSGLRQSLAIGICFLALMYVQERKPIKFLLAVLLASLFHSTAWIFIFAYPIYHIRIGRPVRFGTIAALPVIYVFRETIFNIVSKLFRQNATSDNNGAITLFLVFSLVYAFCTLLAGRSKEENGLMNLFFVACCVQALGGLYSTAIRVGYYFMQALVLLLPLISARTSDAKQAFVMRLVIGVCFVAFGLYSLYNGSWAMSYPYYWYWATI